MKLFNILSFLTVGVGVGVGVGATVASASASTSDETGSQVFLRGAAIIIASDINDDASSRRRLPSGSGSADMTNSSSSSASEDEDTADSDSDTSSNSTSTSSSMDDTMMSASEDKSSTDNDMMNMTSTTGASDEAESDSVSTTSTDYKECPIDKHGCYCCEKEYDGGDLSCRTDHKGRYCCGAEDQCSENAVHPTTDASTSTSADTSTDTDASTDPSADYKECPIDKHGCYCCEKEYDGGDLSCRTDHKGRYCCGAEDQCSEDAVHPATDASTSTDTDTDSSTDASADFEECPIDKHGCYCCEKEYDGGDLSCRTDHKGRYCCGAEDQCSEDAVHPTTDASTSTDTDASTDASADFEECPVDKHGCYCCEKEYDGGDLSCRTDHKGRYCCGAEDQCSEDAVHPTTDVSTSTSADTSASTGTSSSTSADTSTATDASTDASTDTTSTGPSASADTSTSADVSADTSTSTSEDTSSSSGDCTTIENTICAMEDTTVFCDILQNDTEIEMNVYSDKYTLFVPTDDAFSKVEGAFEDLSDSEAGRVIGFHIYQGIELTSSELVCGEKITSINSFDDTSRTKCDEGGNKYQKGNGNTKTGSLPKILSADNMACNGVIHTLDYVMFPVSLTQLEDNEGDASSNFA